jgi:hypothetical protein
VFENLAKDLEQEFPGKLDITGEKSSFLVVLPSGVFDVFVQTGSSTEVKDMTRIFSKKGGDGMLDTAEKKQKIKDFIRKTLEAA